MTRSARWTLADLVDFDHFLATAPDAAVPVGIPVAPQAGESAANARRRVFHAWVQAQRGDVPTPGQRLQRAESLLGSAAALLGGLAGAALAGVWLAQGGAEPVNAPLFWVATVGLQLGLLALGLAGWLARRRLGAGLHGLLQGLLIQAGGGWRRLPGEPRDALRAALGRMVLRQQGHGRLVSLAAVALAQRFGLAFNVGLLVAMLALHLPLVDLRFGWQSTYPVSAAQMHAVVQAVATPWRWAWPQAQPSAAEVAATRYGRGQAAATLPAEAGRAWWPFLALSVAWYGLLLRAALWLGVIGAQRRLLASLPLDHPEARALWRRLAGPPLSVQGGQARLPEMVPVPPAASAVHGAWVAVVAHELTLDDAALAARLHQRLGAAGLGLHRMAIDDRAAGAPVLAALATQQPCPAVLVIVAPASRDPIVAVALFLRAALQAAPDAEGLLLLDAADAPRLQLWQRFVQIQRLRLGVEAL